MSNESVSLEYDVDETVEQSSMNTDCGFCEDATILQENDVDAWKFNYKQGESDSACHMEYPRAICNVTAIIDVDISLVKCGFSPHMVVTTVTCYWCCPHAVTHCIHCY